jgi:MFS family permease
MQEGPRFSALYVRDFRLFLLGQVISLSGTWMHSVAQSWLVYSLTKSPLYLGIIASLSSLPILLFTLLGGTVADRYPKRNILIITQCLSLLSALTVGVLADTEVITVWHIGLIACFLGTVNAFDVPTRQSFVAEVVSRGEITNAIALNSAAFNGARIIGPVIAGLFIAHLGIPACFYANSVSFIPVIVALSLIRAKTVTPGAHRSFLRTIADGWDFVTREKPTRSIIGLIAVFSLFGIPYVTLLPVLAGEILGSGAAGLSSLVASGGAGAFLGALVIAFRGEIRRKRVFIPAAALVFSFGMLGLSFSGNLYVSMGLIFAASSGITSFLAAGNSFIQNAVPDALRGRVMSLYTFVFLGFAPLGNSLIGVIADACGTVFSLKIFALVCIAGSMIFTGVFRRCGGDEP